MSILLNKLKKSLIGDKKKVNCLGTSGRKEQHGYMLHGFSFCFLYPQNANRHGHTETQENLIRLVKALGKKTA